MNSVDIGGTHIEYYYFCKRQLWFYVNNIQLENKSEFVNISKIEHEDFYKKEK